MRGEKDNIFGNDSMFNILNIQFILNPAVLQTYFVRGSGGKIVFAEKFLLNPIYALEPKKGSSEIDY